MELFRKASLIAAIVGGLGSVALMLMSGLRPPIFLIVLFIGWVLTPFVVLALAVVFSGRWSELTRRRVYSVAFVIALFSLAVYTYVLIRPPASQPAFPYVAVPIGSVLLIVAALSISALLSRSKSG